MMEDEVIVMARMAGLAINPAHLAEVARNLEMLFAQAGLLGEQPIPAVIEPAPVFRA